MNLIHNIVQMFLGMSEFVNFFRSFWTALPVPCQLLLSFSFGIVLIIGLLKMVT